MTDKVTFIIDIEDRPDHDTNKNYFKYHHLRYSLKPVQPNLLHRNRVNEPQLSFSTISAVFERVGVCLHELLIFILQLLHRPQFFLSEPQYLIICNGQTCPFELKSSLAFLEYIQIYLSYCFHRK